MFASFAVPWHSLVWVVSASCPGFVCGGFVNDGYVEGEEKSWSSSSWRNGSCVTAEAVAAARRRKGVVTPRSRCRLSAAAASAASCCEAQYDGELGAFGLCERLLWFVRVLLLEEEACRAWYRGEEDWAAGGCTVRWRLCEVEVRVRGVTGNGEVEM